MKDFNLVDKRQLLHNEVDWSQHFLLTYRKETTHVVLNVTKLGELSEEAKVSLLVKMLDYLYGRQDPDSPITD